MTTKDIDACECTYFEEGDWVESRLNSDVFGIIVGQNNFGQFYTVQLAGSLKVETFFAVTLRHMEVQEDEGGGAKQKPPTEDNVIKVDFTKPRALRPSDDTEGAA
ncbi:hypothetical protein ABIA16_003838 [Sinorhizobium fredii]